MINQHILAENNYQKVLDFWFSKETSSMWFKKDPNFDNMIKENFLPIYKQAINKELNEWLQNPQSALALVIVLDQFPRNMFRNTPEAFASDEQALDYAKQAIEKGFDQEIDISRLPFLYMPFMHSEKLAEQDRSIELFSKPGLEMNLEYAKEHREIILRFGRYPHRNIILKRKTTKEEEKFLAEEHSGY